MKLTKLKGKKILVTGGAGFIGSHIVDALVNIGAKVRVLDNLSTGKRENLLYSQQKIEFIEGDIRDLSVCIDVTKGIDIVCHQAALGSVPRSLENPAATIEVNVVGTTNVFMAARDNKVKKIVYASSSSVYGDSEKLPKKEGEEGNPLSPYALSKVMNENLACIFSKCYKMELIGLRYFNVYGPRQNPEGSYAAVIPRFFKAYLNGTPPIIYGDGEQTRDFTYVDEVVKANLLCFTAESVHYNKSYNISGGVSVSINNLAKIIGKICKREEIVPEYRPPREGDIRHSKADLVLAKTLGYVPSISLEKGLRKTYLSFKRYFENGGY